MGSIGDSFERCVMKMVQVLAAAVVMTAAIGARGQETETVQGTVQQDGRMGVVRGGNVTWVPAESAEAKAATTSLTATGVAMMRSAAAGAERPAVVVTEKLPAKVRGEWEEDLAVMDKLVAEAIHSAGGAGSSQAMGIFVRPDQEHGPLYIEGSGVVVMGAVRWPLMGSAKAPGGGQPAAPASAWDAAKQQLSTGADAQTVEARLLAKREAEMRYMQGASAGATLRADRVTYQPAEMPAPFSEERVALLRKGIVAALLEAKHFRHLKPEEFVTVTVSGENDVGQAVRWTLRAQKADIDAAGAGSITVEQFAGKVKDVIQ